MPEQPPPRVLINTVPKAGTYLVSELARRLGFGQTHLHLTPGHVDAYDPSRLEEGRAHPERFRRTIPLHESVGLVGPGEFAAGHLAATPEIIAALHGLRVVFVRRDLRAALVSSMRFHHETGRPGEGCDPTGDDAADLARFVRGRGALLIERARAQLPWLDRAGVLQLRFEAVRHDPAGAIDELRAFLGRAVGPPRDAAELAAGVTGSRTLTRSAAPADPRPCWTDETERTFGALGGPALNAAYGYADAALRSA